MPNYFFSATRNAHNQLTGLFDFVWPTAAAMWNLRWQVNGYVQSVPDATVEQLRARFTEGADIHGANLRRSCIDHTWVAQKEIFAGVVLVNSIAVFEGWLDEVLGELGIGRRRIQIINKSLQFPDSVAIGGQGAAWAISEITNVESIVMKNSFYPTLSKRRHFNAAKLQETLLCYRFFKELRNCSMHGGGVADQRLVDAYTAFSHVATISSLGVTEVPSHHAVSIGAKVQISLRGVVGFSHLILRLIATFDAEMARADAAERVFIKQWKSTHPRLLNFRLSATTPQNRVKKSLEKAGFPVSADLVGLSRWLMSKNLIAY